MSHAEAAVVDAHEVENGGVEIVGADGVFYDIVSKVVGFAVGVTGLHAAPGHPDGEATGVVVSAVGGFVELTLAVRSSSEFSPADDEGVVKKAALLEVGDEAVDGVVDVAALVGKIIREVGVLVPAAVEDLDGADAAFAHAAGEEAGVGKGPGLEGFGSVKVEDVLGFVLEIGQFGHAVLHAPGHFVLQAAGRDFVIAHPFVVELVELGHAIDHRSAQAFGNAGGVGEVKDGVAGTADGDALVIGGENAGAPEAGVDGLARFATGPGRGHDKVVGEGAIHRFEGIREPRAEGGAARDLRSGLDRGHGGVVVDVLGVDRFDEAEVIGHFGEIGQELAEPGFALAVLLEFVLSPANRVGGGGGHAGEAELGFDETLAVPDGEHLLLVVLVEQGLVVVEVLL